MKSKAGLGDWECYRGLVHGALLNGLGSTGFTEKVYLNTDLKAWKSATQKKMEKRAFWEEKIVSTKAIE